jgi:hypothetical protein
MMVRMDLMHSLTLIGLLVGALDYAVVIRHRAERREAAQRAVEARQHGLQGLVRVFLAEPRS